MDTHNPVAEVVRRIVGELGGSTPPAKFAQLLYSAASADEIALEDAASLAREASGLFEFISHRAVGEHKLRVRPAVSGGSTLVEIVNDDMPFLVDSVMGEIQARNLRVRLVVHPIFKCTRSAEGHMTSGLGTADQNWGDGQQESVIAVHLDAIPEASARDLAQSLSQILSEVRIAVSDWRAMLKRVDSAIRDLDDLPAHVPADIKAESLAFMRWLQDGHFTLLGVREYAFSGNAQAAALTPVEGTSLGLLRDASRHVVARDLDQRELTPRIREFMLGPVPLLVTKSDLECRVHRRTAMDYIGVKLYAQGSRGRSEPTGELRIVGLFTSRAYTQATQQIPFVRHKVATLLTASGFPPASHAGKTLVNILDTFPRDELFQIGERELSEWTTGILDLELRPRVRLLARFDRFERFVSVLLYAPRDRYNTAVRERIGALLTGAFGGHVAAFQPYFAEGPLVRVHFIVSSDRTPRPDVDIVALEREIDAILQNWNDRVRVGLDRLGADGSVLAARYLRAFPAAYAETYAPERAIEDMRRIERLSATDLPVAIDFYRDPGMPPHRLRAAIYRFGEAIRLSERVPLLENLGFSVIDERSYKVQPSIGGASCDVALHDMVVETADGTAIDLPACDQRLEDAFLAVFRQAAENDGFNRLVLAAGATWHEAAIVRAYASYMRQISIPLGLRGIADVLLRHAGVVRDLLELFHIRLGPEFGSGRRQEAEQIVRARIDSALGNVASLDDDRILRHLVNLIGATLRTNVFQRQPDNQPPDTIAFKFDSKSVDAAPAPRPYREIWVYSPRVEGIHLRFAPIARGGIRWSDRAQDFRTEVLGLVKAQLVKNAVIVPSGAKGGFYPKQLPRGGSRDDVMKEGVASYRSFISSLLSITDNLRDGTVVAPERVVRHDGDDPYLVVAADKGTATFSDYANDIAAAHAFWLGDAFASGGSAGYDHKKMAITARGAWECVKRHFQEMDIDIQKQPFRVIGVGDMSGDVFGNGMLLSEAIRLVAAFDHRDIFIDPEPDPAKAFAERKRLFDLPRSSWQDYDRAKLSKGGCVISRSAKFVDLTPEAAALLGLKRERATPGDVINAILKLEADLLWLGGIGTYVRGGVETDEQVGDRANDAIRITADQLRVKVIGEGANLGLTQKARIEFAQRGGRVNTDFIDNSAGVNSSDQEVNIKIALGRATRSGELAGAGRTAFLAQMTDEVATACLRNNQQQSLALSLVERRGAADVGRTIQLIQSLEQRGLVDRKLEALPDDAELLERRARGRGLSRPELAVLLSYSKIALLQDLLESTVPDEARLESWLIQYFPAAIRERYGEDIRGHRLRREIIATGLTNAVVNRAGPAYAVCLAGETNRSTADAARAYLATRYVFDTPELADRIEATCTALPAADRLDLLGRVQVLVGQVSSWFIRDGAACRQLDATIDLHKSGAAQLAGALDATLPSGALGAVDQARSALASGGVPDDLARYLARLAYLRRAPEITAIAASNKRSIADAARVFFAIGSHLGLDRLIERAALTPAADTYDRLAIAEAENQFIAAHSRLAGAAFKAIRNAAEVEAWLGGDNAAVRQISSRISALAVDPALSVSRLTVAAAQLSDAIRD